jgi:hypothetical protein
MSTLTETAPGYKAGRTLPLRVELIRQLKRRRTIVMGGILAALPFVLLVAFAIGGEPGGRNNTVSLMDTATASGANFAAVNLFVSAGFLLVIPVALFCGDTVASEAGWSSLRYLLAAPVPRARLLWSKLVVGLGLSLAAMILLPVVALAVGTAAYGWGSLELPSAPMSVRRAGVRGSPTGCSTTRSGGVSSFSARWWRRRHGVGWRSGVIGTRSPGVRCGPRPTGSTSCSPGRPNWPSCAGRFNRWRGSWPHGWRPVGAGRPGARSTCGGPCAVHCRPAEYR